MKNVLGRDIPESIRGMSQVKPYSLPFSQAPSGFAAGRALRCNRPGNNKVLHDIGEAVEASGLNDGMTISFHHHFRDGDDVVRIVMEEIQRRGIKDLTLAASSLTDVHEFLIDMIEDGTVTAIETSGLRGKLGEYVTMNSTKLKRPVCIRSHGGRARAIEAGEVKIDVAFMGVSACDRLGNANGTAGKSPCGALGYAKIDARNANKVILITDTLIEGYLYPFSIPQTDVDYIVKVESIGNPERISSGAIRISRDPVQLLLAKYAAMVIEDSGYFNNGYSLQLGSGGASLSAALFIRERMVRHNIKGGFALGGATGISTAMLSDGLFEVFYDTQSFDQPATVSLRDNPRHVEISASHYASPWNAGPLVNDLDIVILSATEVDLDFNVNVITNSNGIIMGASGGHSDTAAGAKLAMIVMPLIRGRLPMIRDKVQNIITPGETIDVIVTERGIAVNPRRDDLKENLRKLPIPILSLEELQSIAYKKVGKPNDIPLSDDIVGVIEGREGGIMDVIRRPLIG